jgi:GT2 family glycosyltransferase/glycosyltransferase involved in cell wall biosynthesis
MLQPVSVLDLQPGEELPHHESEVVVVIPLYGAHDHFVRCLSSVLRHTPRDVPIVVADDASPDPTSREWAAELDAAGVADHAVSWVRQPSNVGFVHNCNAAFALCAPADVLLLNSDCVVAAGWSEGLRAAAYSDSINATATALTNHGTIVSVPRRNEPRPMLPQDTTLDEAAAAVRSASPRLHPRLPAAIGHCVWIRRTALDLVGDFDEAFAPAYGEEVDFSQRCVLNGLQHVLADDVLVAHHGGASLDLEGERNPLQKAHDAIIDSRYAYYTRVVKAAEVDATSPLARSLAVARRVLQNPSVTIDARCLGPYLTGTQLHTLELIGALWRTRRAHIRVVLPEVVGEYARDTLDVMPGLELIEQGTVKDETTAKTDVVHRAYQVSGPDDLRFLSFLGERLVITNQDLIAYRNPGYFPSAAHWLSYRKLTAEALGMAGIAVFFSQHAANDALAEDLVSADRVRVVPIGVDHRLGSLKPPPTPPAHDVRLDDRPYLLCIGTRFRHKNRVFALRLLEALRERHGWKGRLVLAGPEVAAGSSSGEEAAWLAARPGVAEHVVDLPAVDEAEKWWLYEHATAVVYPSAYEGFGLIPFEAADVGKPCLFAWQSSLAEFLPESTATLVAWNAAASADRVIEVLRDSSRAARLVADVRSAAERLTWDSAAEGLLAAYDDAVRLPARDIVRLTGADMTLDARYWNLRQAIGPTGLSLVAPEKRLLPEDVQRTLAALARRPATRGPLLAALRAMHRLGVRAAGSAATTSTAEAVEAHVIPDVDVDPPVERRSDNGGSRRA